jgi:hypothetical protein
MFAGGYANVMLIMAIFKCSGQDILFWKIKKIMIVIITVIVIIHE